MSTVEILSPETGLPVNLLEQQGALALSESYATFMAGGWGSGKSMALVAWLAMRAMENPPGTRGMVVMPTFDMMDRFVNNALLPALRHLVRGHKISKRTIYLPNGRQLLYRSGHKPERVEMDNLCYVGLDEAGLMPRMIFTKAAARVRDARAKRLALGLTGVPLWGWLKEEFDGKADDKRRIIRAHTEANVHLHPDYAENLRATCPSRQAEMYLHGAFVPPGGTVYPEFDEAIHCIDWKPQPQFPIGVIIDWGARSPHVLFVQRIPKGTMLRAPFDSTDRDGAVVFDELIADGASQAVTTERLCHLILAKYSKIHWGACDPADGGVHPTSGLNQIGIANRILDLKLRFTTDPKLTPIKAGIEHLKSMLAPYAGKPSLYFAKTLLQNHSPRATLNAIRAYSYPKEKDGRPMDDEPDKDGISDHAVDCLRYCAINYFPIIRLQSTIRSAA
jgi:hypothetical protein